MGKANYFFKTAIIGDAGVGKTQMINRFVNDEFARESKASVGVDYAKKQIQHDGIVIECQVRKEPMRSRTPRLCMGWASWKALIKGHDEPHSGLGHGGVRALQGGHTSILPWGDGRLDCLRYHETRFIREL
jgi:hypothetical protein